MFVLRLVPAALVVLTTACQPGSSVPRQIESTPSMRAEPAAIATSQQPSASDVNPSSAKRESMMEKTCGSARVRLDPGRAPGRTILTFQSADGTARVAAPPAGLSGYSAVGLACASGRDGDDYIVVQYGEIAGGCSICEWFALYDTHGAPLTRNEPAIVEDPSMPPAQRQSPNNAEYEAALERLGIQHPEIDLAS